MQQYQNRVLKALSHRIDDFCLAGGTALCLFHFRHRESLDLDFFTPDFSRKRVKEIVSGLKKDLGKDIKPVAQNLKKGRTRMVVYQIAFTAKDVLKIDFVEDIFPLIGKSRLVEGIKILSLEDIYLRKVYALAGGVRIRDEVGRKTFGGGRQEPKDFYDLYFLSHTFMPLSKFADKYGDAVLKESLITWFHTYDRIQIMHGVLELDADREIDLRKMENHFQAEIDKIIESEVEGK